MGKDVVGGETPATPRSTSDEIIHILEEWLESAGNASYLGVSIDDERTDEDRDKQYLMELDKAHDKMNNLLIQEHERGVSIGMGRAKTAITVAMNTGSTTMQELRAVLDKEIKWWNDNLSASVAAEPPTKKVKD